MALDRINATAILDGGVTSADLDTNIAVTGNLSSGGALTATGQFKANGGVVINEDSLDVDFRVESNGNGNTLFVDGGTDRVGIKTGTPGYEFEIATNSGTTTQRISRGGNYLDFGGLSSGTIYIKGYEGVVAIGNEFTGPLDLLTSDTAQVRITAAGDVGIGNTDPHNIVGNHGGGLVLRSDAARAESTTLFGIRDSSGNLSIQHLHNGTTVFNTGTTGAKTEIVRIDGNGLKFNGDTAAANALHDYEEGSWTPNIGADATYTNQQGIYTKIGRYVSAAFDITINARNSGSTAQMFGLPFTVNNGVTPVLGVHSGHISFYSSLAQNVYSLDMYAINGQTYVYFTGHTVATGNIGNALSVFGNGTRIVGTVHYYAN